MRKLAICLLLLLCSLAAMGDGKPVPQWSVIKAVHISGTTTIPGTVLFTPTATAIYRISIYMSISSTIPQTGVGWSVFYKWTDPTGLGESAGTSPYLEGGAASWSVVNPQVFSIQSGTPLVVQVLPSDPAPQNATYKLTLTVERLE
jgi:hypothetical protein